MLNVVVMLLLSSVMIGIKAQSCKGACHLCDKSLNISAITCSAEHLKEIITADNLDKNNTLTAEEREQLISGNISCIECVRQCSPSNHPDRSRRQCISCSQTIPDCLLCSLKSINDTAPFCLLCNNTLLDDGRCVANCSDGKQNINGTCEFLPVYLNGNLAMTIVLIVVPSIIIIIIIGIVVTLLIYRRRRTRCRRKVCRKLPTAAELDNSRYSRFSESSQKDSTLPQSAQQQSPIQLTGTPVKRGGTYLPMSGSQPQNTPRYSTDPIIAPTKRRATHTNSKESEQENVYANTVDRRFSEGYVQRQKSSDSTDKKSLDYQNANEWLDLLHGKHRSPTAGHEAAEVTTGTSNISEPLYSNVP